MKWDIQTVGFNPKAELLDYTKDKVGALNKYYDQIVGAEVYLKLVQDNHRETKVAEIKLNIPGRDIFAHHQSDSFEKSLSETIEKLKGQIRKLKTKFSNH